MEVVIFLTEITCRDKIYNGGIKMGIKNERLIKLRQSKGYSQSQLARELEKYTKEIVLEGETGKNTISQIENGRNINLEMACAYCKIFDTTLDYIYGRTNVMKPNYESIKEELGLDDMTIYNLEMLKKYKDNADKNPDVYKYGYETTKRLAACNYLINNACNDFNITNQEDFIWEKSLLDNIFTYISSEYGIDDDKELEFIESTSCNNQFEAKIQRRKLKQLVLLDIQEDLINLRNKQHGE